LNPPLPPEDWWRFADPVVWVPTAGEMALIDGHAIASGAIPERALIENAGRALAHRVQARWPEGRVLTLAGSGHNGADALVAARTLHAWGRTVELVRCGSRPPEPDVLAGWDLALSDVSCLDEALSRAEVVLDGILGTGVTAAPRAPQAGIIDRVNASGRRVVAVDGPSGVDFTTGGIPGASIRAELTVTFGWPKLGLLRFPARARCGTLEVVEIGFPPPGTPPGVRALTPAWVGSYLPEPGDDAHKGRAGYLTLVGGRVGMAGAVVLAARAAIRSGVGIVRIVSAPGNREVIQTAVPGAVFVDWDDRGAVTDALAWASAVAVGPGLGAGPEQIELARTVVAERGEKPLAIDADGLNAWAGDPEALREANAGDALLTPHPGELARLIEVTIDEVLADPLAAARGAAATTGCTVLLKGTPVWVADTSGAASVTVHASPVFAGGGMGDVLAGACGAFLASGLRPGEAAGAALMVSALGVLGGASTSGIVAEDVPDLLPLGRRRLRELTPGGWPGVVLALPAAVESRPQSPSAAT